MKKFYLILFMFVCIGANARVLDKMTTPNRLSRQSVSHMHKAPASENSDQWTEWQQFGTGTFTMDDGFEIFLGLEGYTGDHPDIKVDRRENIANPSIQQFRFNGIFNNADIVLDYDDATGRLVVNPQAANIDYFGDPSCPLKAVDAATMWPVLGPSAGFDEESIADLQEEYASYNYYIPTLGRFYVYFAFFFDGYNDAVCLSDCKLQLDGYPDFTPGIELSKYVTKETSKAKVTFPEETAYALYAVSNRPHSQSLLNYIIENGETENMIFKMTEPGEIALPSGNHNKVSDLIVISFDSKGNALEMNSSLFTVIDDEAGQWTSLGKAAVYADILESTVFETDGNSYEVELQQNNENKALFRVVDLYGEASPLTKPEHLHAEFPHYLVFDTTDPEMVQVAHTDLGIDMGGGSFYVYADATQKLYDGKTVEDIKEGGRCGTYVDGMISFPEAGLQILADDFSVFGGIKNAAYACGGFQLDLEAASSGIEDVTVDAGVGIQYFNLQGMPVSNPSAGVYIRRQGHKSVKVFVK